jgi:hypothetical protein
MSAQTSELTMLTDLFSLQWKNRLIIVNDVQNGERVLALFEKNTSEINDRDIVWFMFKGSQTFTNYTGKLSGDFLANTREKYRVGQGEVVLIGKDGATKFRLDRVDLEAIFSEIDAMPMRQNEMQN